MKRNSFFKILTILFIGCLILTACHTLAYFFDGHGGFSFLCLSFLLGLTVTAFFVSPPQLTIIAVIEPSRDIAVKILSDFGRQFRAPPVRLPF